MCFSGGLDFEGAVVDGQEGDTESSSTKIEDEDIALASGLLDGSGSLR